MVVMGAMVVKGVPLPVQGAPPVPRQELPLQGSVGCFLVKKGIDKDKGTDDGKRYLVTVQHAFFYGNDEEPLGCEARITAPGCSACTSARVGSLAYVNVKMPVQTLLYQDENPNQVLDSQVFDVGVDIALVSMDPGTEWRACIFREPSEGGTIDINGEDELYDLQALYRLYPSDRAKGDKLVEGQKYKVFMFGARSREKRWGVITSLRFNVKHQPNRQSPTDGEIDFENTILIRSLEKGKPFAVHGDSGSVILNDQNEVVGLLFAGDGVEASATPIKAIRAWTKATLGFELEVATAEKYPGVQTVPSSGSLPALSETTSAFAAPAPVGTWGLRAQVQASLLQTRAGDHYSQLILKHQHEVRMLVETNQRVATVWQRNGGPLMVHHLIDAARHPDVPLPEVLEGRPLDAALESIFHILCKYGSAALIADIETYQQQFTSLLRLSYTQLLERLRTLDV